MKRLAIGRFAALMLAVAVVPAALPGASAAPLRQFAQQDTVDDTGDAAGTVVRLGRLEDQLRTLTGQIEQLQYQNRKLEENLRKLQADTDFRFQDLQRGAPPAAPRAPAKRSDAAPDATTPPSPATIAATATPPVDAARPAAVQRAGDAFDPDANPDAPGAPRPLGTTSPSPPLGARPARQAAADGNAPLDLMRNRAAAAPPDAAAAPAPAAVRDTAALASLAPGGTRDEYESDLGLYKQGQYENAATGFAAFADKYPKDRLVPDAIYLAGESYARLGRHREAAEQFLKVSTDFGKSPRAPDALLRLGMSLNALGAREQACATYQEVARRYPTAAADVKSGVDRELKRARCSGNG